MREKLSNYELSCGNPIVLKNPQNIYALGQIGEIEFPSQNSGLKYLGTKHIKNQDFFWGILWSFNENLALGYRIGVQLKSINIGPLLAYLGITKRANQKEENKVKLFHKVLVTKAMPQRYKI